MFELFIELITFLISLYSKDLGAIILKSFFDDWNLEYEVVLIISFLIASKSISATKVSFKSKSALTLGCNLQM